MHVDDTFWVLLQATSVFLCKGSACCIELCFPPPNIAPDTDRVPGISGDLRMSFARAVAVQPVHKHGYCLAATREVTLVGFNGCGWKATWRLQIPIHFPL